MISRDLIDSHEVNVPYRFLLVLASLLLTVSLLSQAQTTPQNPHIPPIDQNADQDHAPSKMEREMAKKANKERQAAIKRDTDKLLELATQLKENVDKSSENTLSMDVIKKADEIEKLAKSVKDKMKGN